MSLAVLFLIGLAFAGCRHRSAPYMEGGCEDVPVAGPPSTIGLRLSQEAPMPELSHLQMGRLVGLLRWSSESLAVKSVPAGAVLRVSQPERQFDTSLVADSAGLLAVDLPAGPTPYQVRVTLIGAQHATTSVIIRVGHSDTARVLLRHGGFRMCA